MGASGVAGIMSRVCHIHLIGAVMALFFRFFALTALFVATTSPAYAYLDPITGSLIIQGLIALVAAIVAGVKSVRTKVVGLFSSIFNRKDS